jgi:hypothetical protein
MTFADATLTIGATAMRDSITHFQLHSAAPGASGATAAVGTRVASGTGVVDADGDITWTVNFTGLPANQPVTHVTYWSAAAAGVLRGMGTLSTTPPNDTSANAAGEITLTIVESSNAV